MIKSFYFLCYINRSGSTYLAKLLNKYKEVGVTIESPFPDGVLYKELIIENEKELDKKILKLYNPKFKEWGITPDEIKIIILKKGNFPVSFREIFYDILELYFKKNKPDSKKYIYKTAWNYLVNYKKVREFYPEAKFIFIIRDGRAIYNSQKKSLSSLQRKPMSDNPIRTAFIYKKVEKILNLLKEQKWLYILKYENLILNTEEEIDKLLDFLSVKEKTKDYFDYYEKIPENQKHLHKNLAKPPLKERIFSWEKELSKEEIYIFQKIARDALITLGYKMKEINFNFLKRQKVFLKYLILFLIFRIKDKIFSFAKPKYLINRLWYKYHKFFN